MPDILFILLLALIIFGPKRLPEVARQIGKWTLQFRNLSNDLRAQLESEMLKIELEEREKHRQAAAPTESKTVAALDSHEIDEPFPLELQATRSDADRSPS